MTTGQPQAKLLDADIRRDFPILQTTMNGKPLVFLDSAASSQQPLPVIEAARDYHLRLHANTHRGAYRLSYEATELYEKARETTAKFLNAAHPNCIVFTRNTTESVNLVANTWGLQNIGADDEIVVSDLEHHSNLVPWMMLAERTGAKLRFAPLTSDQRLHYDALDQLINPRTKLVAIAHMSNAVGTIHDLKRIGDSARAAGAAFLIDGAQGACHLTVDVQALDCDFYVFSAHKMLGPTGVGVLYGKKHLLEAMPPFMGGGHMILTVSRGGFEAASLPDKFEAGTTNICGVIAFAKALDYLSQIGLENIHRHELALLEYAREKCRAFPGLHVYGPADINQCGGILSFNLKDVHPHDIGTVLDDCGVAVRAGHHCCEPFMRSLDISGTVRASFYLYTDISDVDALIAGIHQVQETFRRVLK